MFQVLNSEIVKLLVINNIQLFYLSGVRHMHTVTPVLCGIKLENIVTADLFMLCMQLTVTDHYLSLFRLDPATCCN